MVPCFTLRLNLIKVLEAFCNDRKVGIFSYGLLRLLCIATFFRVKAAQGWAMDNMEKMLSEMKTRAVEIKEQQAEKMWKIKTGPIMKKRR